MAGDAETGFNRAPRIAGVRIVERELHVLGVAFEEALVGGSLHVHAEGSIRLQSKAAPISETLARVASSHKPALQGAAG